VQIFWNGTLLKQVSLAAPTPEKKQLLTIGPFPSLREGTVRMRVSSSGHPVQIDGLAVSSARPEEAAKKRRQDIPRPL
jgi:hypothetical protein